MNVFFNLLVYLVWFLATYYSVYFLLSLFFFRKGIHESKSLSKEWKPFVTFLIPAYNEEDVIEETIQSLENVTYENIEFIILNDGSKDKTSEKIQKAIQGKPRFRFIDNKQNKGKAAVLNQGIQLAKGEIIGIHDADSRVEPNIVQKCLPYFLDEKVGAVTVSVEVKNKDDSWLHKIIAIEFNLGLSLFLKIFSFLGIIFVTPGPFSLYRKKMLLEIGGFDTNNITEDHEIAFRIHKAGYLIENNIHAKVETIIPQTFKQIYIQRRRWYAGAIQTLMKHKDMLFNPRFGIFGYYLPIHYTLIFLGLFTFLFANFLSLSRFLREFLYYRYTNYNFLDHFKISMDLLTYGKLNILGISMFFMTLFLMIIGLYFLKKRFSENKLGILGFPFLFYLYQLYWIGATWAYFTSKKIRWK